ncbi:tetratricopeptide repeat protein [Flammeovirgaceae bacterium SG7u.111]|nr:tetratricopeptide repeat protein [Flammeovirgaceae bacterium SG7u.132]WPO37710.1 tetratricopeptide repeat protein [Flammeovirgaceae bacterium SG7u.111]
MKTISLRFFILLFPFLLPTFAFSQTQQVIDSLEQVLEKELEGKDRVDLLNTLSYRYQFVKPIEAIVNGTKALKLSKEIGYKEGEANAYSMIQSGYYYQGNDTKALEYLLKAIKAFEDIEDDTSVARHYYYLGSFHRRHKQDSLAHAYYAQALAVYEKLEDEKGISGVLNSTGRVSFRQGKYDEALEYFHKALVIREKLGVKATIAYSLSDIGRVQLKKGDPKEAEKFFRKSLTLYKETEDNKGISETIALLGESLLDQKKYSSSQKLLAESLELAKNAGFKSTLLDIYVLYIRLSVETNKYAQAYEYQVAMTDLDKQLHDESAQTKIASMQSGFELDKKQAEIDLLNKDKELSEKESKQRMTFIVGLLASLCMVTGLVVVQKRQNELKKKANSKLKEQNDEINSKNSELETLAETLAEQRNQIEKNLENIEVLSKIGQEITSQLTIGGIVKTVYERINHLSVSSSFAIGLYNEDSNNMTFFGLEDTNKTLVNSVEEFDASSSLATWSFEKQEAILIGDVESEYRQFIPKKPAFYHSEERNSLVYVPLTLKDRPIGVLTVQNKRKNVYGEYELNFLKNMAVYTTIALINSDAVEEIERQKALITKKNDDILASMTYAGRIQSTLLPQQATIEKVLPESFVLFQPKDIVSGDFYWVSSKEDRTYVIAIDCTGHGVPGAIMSILAHEMVNIVLNIRGITSPELILKNLHVEVRNTLRQYETNNREGMDMSICVVDKTNKQLEFAGAKNPLVYIKNGELTEIKGDRLSIGGQLKHDKRKFTKHIVPIDAPTSFYLFSDGYQDQFGGAEGRKFMGKQLKAKLLEICDEPMEAQGKILKEILAAWQGDKEKQTDDILVIGAKV